MTVDRGGLRLHPINVDETNADDTRNSCLKEKRKGGRSFTVKASKKNKGLVKSDCHVSHCSSESSMLAFL